MKKVVISLFAFVLFFSPALLFAAPQGGIGTVDPANIGKDNTIISNEDSISNIFVNLINWFTWIVALVSVVMALYAGILFIISAGDDAKIKKAKDILVYVVIGIIVAVLSFSIVSISKALMG